MMISSDSVSKRYDECASNLKVKMVEGNHNYQHECDVLLNNFQIKKNRYKVLLNYDHIVWERFDLKHCGSSKHNGNNEQTTTAASSAASPTVSAAEQKEAEYEKEQLTNKVACGSLTNVVQIHDVIRVSKGDTKSASVRHVQNLQSQNVSPETQDQSVRSRTTPTDLYLTIHYAERIVLSPTDCNRWRIRRLTLHNSDSYIIANWYDCLQKLMVRSAHSRIKRLLVFINPYGGRKKGLQIYERSCKPTIQLAGIDASCIITQRANQIRDILMSHDMTSFDAVCCVGGDGTVAEMMNGLILRAIQDKGLDIRRPKYIPKPTLSVGIIPAGSTDTIVHSLHGTSDAETAAIHLVLGHKRGVDVCSVSNRDGIVRFCTSVMGYGYLGDVAANSEKYRWMGTKRYEYTGVKTFLLNRGYEAEVHILLKENELENDQPLTEGSANEDVVCHVNCEKCKLNSYSTDIEENKPCSSTSTLHISQKSEGYNFKTDNEHSRIFDNNGCNNANSNTETEAQTIHGVSEIEIVHKGRSTSPISSTLSNEQHSETSSEQKTDVFHKWRVIRGEFFMISGANISCACLRSPNGISAYCHLGDGNIDLVLVRKTHLLNNIRYVINAMGRSGDARTLPFVEIYRTKQFMFKTKLNTCPEDYNSVRGSSHPIADSYAEADSLHSSWNCDGEVVTDLDITMTSHRQLIDVLMRGPYLYTKPQKASKIKSILCCCNAN